MSQKAIDTTERPPLLQTIPLSLQDPLATVDPRVDALIAQIDASSPTIPA